MKHFLPTFALLISSLFAPVAVSAQPGICNGPSGLVYVPTFACSDANVGVFPAFTIGDCLVVAADMSLGMGACGPTNAALLSANQTFTGLNTFEFGLASGIAGTDSNPGNNGAALTIGTAACSGQTGNTSEIITNSSSRAVKGIFAAAFGILCGSQITPILALDGSGNLAISGRVYATGVTNSGTYVDSTSSATLQLGQSGAPSGACISGSIWTNAAGTTLATTRYTCVATVWVGG